MAGAMAYAHRDLLFPSYRQPGLLLVRGMPVLAMMCQCLGNRFDHTKGRQMPVHYSWRAGNVVSISSPVGTQLPQAVGAAMAFAYRGERNVVGTWVGDGTSAQGDFHYALNFASVYRPPCVLHVVDNQWAISTHRNIDRRWPARSPRGPKPTACPACAWTATTSSPSMRPSNGRSNEPGAAAEPRSSS